MMAELITPVNRLDVECKKIFLQPIQNFGPKTGKMELQFTEIGCEVDRRVWLKIRSQSGMLCVK